MKYSLLFIALLFITGYASDSKCRILSFSSGVEKVAYQVGALKAIIEHSDPTEVEYDVISGVSFGAFNAAIIAAHQKGDEKAAIDELYGIWKNSKNIKAYSNWLLGPAQGLMYKGGLYDNTPWKAYLAKVLNGRDATRVMTLGAVNVQNGNYEDLSSLITTEKLEEAIFAATAVNVFFPPVKAFNKYWFDGSGVWPIEVIGPIARCKEMGFQDKDIIVDVLMTLSDQLAQRDADHDTTIPSLVRFIEIAEFFEATNGVERAKAGFPEITFRHLVSPEADNLPTSFFPFDFNQNQVNTLLNRGYNDAMKIMSEEQGAAFERLREKRKSLKTPVPPREVEEFLKGNMI